MEFHYCTPAPRPVPSDYLTDAQEPQPQPTPLTPPSTPRREFVEPAVIPKSVPIPEATDPPSLIPEPVKGINASYVSHVADCDRASFEKAKRLIRETIMKILDINLPWSLQKDSDRERMYLTILSSFPAFNNYHDRWPIVYYCRQQFAAQRSYANAKRLRARGGSNPCYPRRRRRNAGHGSHSARTPHHTIHSTQASRSAASTKSYTAPAVSLGQGKGPSIDNMAQSTNPFLRLQQAVSGEQEVLRFLLAIDASFDSLLDRFMSAGVNNGMRFKTLAQWTAVDRDLFLRREVRLSAFESKVISDGMGQQHVLPM